MQLSHLSGNSDWLPVSCGGRGKRGERDTSHRKMLHSLQKMLTPPKIMMHFRMQHFKMRKGVCTRISGLLTGLKSLLTILNHRDDNIRRVNITQSVFQPMRFAALRERLTRKIKPTASVASGRPDEIMG